MNLDEIGVFKNRVVSKLINDENVLDVLLGNTDNIDDPETLLLGKNGSGEGGCVFKYEYVPDTQENSKTFLCVEVVPEQTSGDSITMMTIYVFAYCSKNLMQTYHRKGQAGTPVSRGCMPCGTAASGYRPAAQNPRYPAKHQNRPDEPHPQ